METIRNIEHEPELSEFEAEFLATNFPSDKVTKQTETVMSKGAETDRFVNSLINKGVLINSKSKSNKDFWYLIRIK
ncbi:MAG: hypothetical protein JNN11_02335 [Candidatus Doudnabacteria bacterium]|nr:hypothetical protein [Candidatus Doudnabacteria bacterium]